ncbi:hypothetical protein, partial [Pseudorhodoplanes sp.]|uniref:hypothetical protein n=1 Tax=Pseudorhodoplanes sp. TaxID=1934341 RepID=UPI002C054C8D
LLHAIPQDVFHQIEILLHAAACPLRINLSIRPPARKQFAGANLKPAQQIRTAASLSDSRHEKGRPDLAALPVMHPVQMVTG